MRIRASLPRISPVLLRFSANNLSKINSAFSETPQSCVARQIPVQNTFSCFVTAGLGVRIKQLEGA